MLTKDELDKVNQMFYRKDKLEKLIKAFNKPCFNAALGIVTLGEKNMGHYCRITGHDDAMYFNNELHSIQKPLNEMALIMLKAKVEDIDSRLNRYIVKDE